jgi:hypothetical protein
MRPQVEEEVAVILEDGKGGRIFVLTLMKMMKRMMKMKRMKRMMMMWMGGGTRGMTPTWGTCSGTLAPV